MTYRICLLALIVSALCLKGAEAKGFVIRAEGNQSCGAWTKAQYKRPQIGADGQMLLTNDQIKLAAQLS